MTIASKARGKVGTHSRRVCVAEAMGAGATPARPEGAAVPQEPALLQQRDAPPEAPRVTPAAPIQQAYRDLMQGLVDTDRGAEAGRTYNRLKA